MTVFPMPHPLSRLWLSPSQPLPSSLTSICDVGDEPGHIKPAQRDQIWHVMKRFYRSGMNPGVTLAIRHRGQLVFDRALGYRNVAQQTPLRVTDPVCLFSASKAVTAMLVHHLVEKGELQLDDKVADYLPEYGCNGKENTTLRDLLTHRAGVPRLPDAKPELLFRKQEAMQRLYQATPETPVGSRQAYHAITAGYILGEVVERVTDQSLNQLLDTLIRQPLGMKYFHYGIDEAARHLVPKHYLTGLKSRFLDKYMRHAVGATLEDVVDVSNDPRFMATTVPAGNLYATAEEVTRFYQMLLDQGQWDGKQLYQPATINQATNRASRPQWVDSSLLLPVRFSAGFMLGERTLSLYGLKTEQAFGHLGFVSITTWADPQRQLSVAMMTTGKGVLGPQLPSMLRLFNTINRLA